MAQIGSKYHCLALNPERSVRFTRLHQILRFMLFCLILAFKNKVLSKAGMSWRLLGIEAHITASSKSCTGTSCTPIVGYLSDSTPVH